MNPSASSDRQTYRVLSALVLALSHIACPFHSTPGRHPLSQMQCPGSTEDFHQAHASRAVLCSRCSPMVMQNSRSCVTGTTATNALVCFRAGAERKHSARALGSWHGCYRCALVERLAHCHCCRHCGKRAITRDGRLPSAGRWQLASSPPHDKARVLHMHRR